MTILEHIFNDIIVALDDSPNAWHALNLAIEIGEHENSRIHGMHVHPPGSEPHDHHPSEERFNQYCQDARIREFNYQFQSGEIGSLLCESARYTDLIVLPLNHPPGQSPIKRLSSGLTTIIRGCPSPILTVPGPNRGIRSILIAFDSSLKALEALFIAAYFGTQFSSNLHVLSSEYGYPEAQESIDQAQAYLSKFPLSAQYHLSENAIPEAIKEIQSQKELDMILMGGYGGSVLQDLVAGSVVDQVLREINLPILICR
jgi:nucleotide-binding universal stress UspA family protein